MQENTSWQGKTILICEDSHLVQASLADFYAKLQLKPVKPVGTGSEALLSLEKAQTDFVSLDIIMPEMQGVECFGHIIERFPKTRPFFVSCLNQPAIISPYMAQSLPLWLFLSKPPQEEEAKDLFKKLLSIENLKEEIDKYRLSLKEKAESASTTETTG